MSADLFFQARKKKPAMQAFWSGTTLYYEALSCRESQHQHQVPQTSPEKILHHLL